MSAAQKFDAGALGVRQPERVRLLCVPLIETFEHPLLRPIGAIPDRFLTPARGLTLRYGILLRDDGWEDRELIAHELAHVAQYERIGGICRFLDAYFRECLDPGYPLGPLEREAILAAANLVRGEN